MAGPAAFAVFSLLLAGIALAGKASAAPPVPRVTGNQFLADCRALARFPHRLTGTPEYREAADYVEKRLREIGADKVIVQSFPTAQTVIRKCELEVAEADGSKKALRLLPMRPDGIIPPVTPEEGLDGPLIYVGQGRAEDFDAMDPRKVPGPIAVLDYNSGDAWLEAFRLGAKAVLFVSEGTDEAWHSHYVDANACLPRFYFPGKKSDLLRYQDRPVVIHSEVTWKTVRGRNLFAYFKGTQPRFPTDESDTSEEANEELVVLAANLDSFGEAPRASPGARGAANCAALLKVAETIRANRPRRHVLLAFFDAQARCHAGSSAFYRIFETTTSDPVHLDMRAESLKGEQEFLSQMEAALTVADPLQTDSPVRRRMLDRLRRMAKEHSDGIKARLYDIRKRQDAIHKELQGISLGSETGNPKSGNNSPGPDGNGTLAGGAPVSEAQLKAEEAGLEKQMETHNRNKDHWNDLLRVIARLRRGSFIAKMAPEVHEKANVMLAEALRDVELRQAELKDEAVALQNDQELNETVGDSLIALHASLLLGDTSSRWGIVTGGDSHLHSATDIPGLYGKIQGVFLAAEESLAQAGAPLKLFETKSADGSMSPVRSLWSAPFLVHSGEVAGKLGIYNLVLATVQENLSREGTPGDSLSLLDVPKLEAQAEEVARMLVTICSGKGLSLRRSIVPDKMYAFTEFKSDSRPYGPMAMGKVRGTSVPNKPMAGVTVQLRLRRNWQYARQPDKIYAFDDFLVLRTNQNGSYNYGPVHKRTWDHYGFAARFDEKGQVEFASDILTERTAHIRLNMYRCRQGALVLPPQVDVQPARALDARTNSLFDDGRSYSKTEDGVVYWFCEDKIEGVKIFQAQALVTLINGEVFPEQEGPSLPLEGVGISLEKPWQFPNIAARSASDLWRVNQARFTLLHSKDIMNSSIEELHGHAENLLLEAKSAESVLEMEALAASAFLEDRPVYNNLRSTLDDLVHAVLVLLALSVPFAFALERLLIGATSVYRQIAWFAGFFCLTFLMLYVSHPAFAVSKTPIIIFLGFTVITLSCLVIFIIMRKFEVELKVLQGLTSTVHAADVSRISTVLAAVSMGISTMRRRPLRTALTATTIILLTFTILCFASFGTRTGIVKLFAESSPAHAGVFVHDVNWSALNPEILDVIRGRWGKDAAIESRYWVSPKNEETPGPLISRADGSRPTPLKGILGLEAGELKYRPEIKALLRITPDQWHHSIAITKAIAEELEVRTGDTVLLHGQALEVGQVLNPAQIVRIKDMDGGGILPVDFVQMSSTSAQQDTGQDAAEALDLQSQQNWAYLAADSVAIVSASNAEKMGAALHGITLYTANTNEATALAENLARTFPLPISATRGDGVYRHVLGTLVAASGAGDLIFPILLGGLVIFGTMLGSVADREREIYTFSALGLAPPHVSSLFFAEALTYSVIGGLGGYLIAQGAMQILSILAGYGWVRVPEMNYSSTNAIVTLLIVMATVLVSAIYPAIKASRSANPGVLRSWRLPRAVGDHLDIVFPFTVSDYDITGVVSFLKEHFDNYGDAGLGVFMSENARLFTGEGHNLGLRSELSLAPFDLGVTQAFELTSISSEVPGIDEVKIRVTRKSGQPKDWHRLNKVLLDDLRRQFLIWRSLPNDTMELYREKTLTELQDIRRDA